MPRITGGRKPAGSMGKRQKAKKRKSPVTVTKRVTGGRKPAGSMGKRQKGGPNPVRRAAAKKKGIAKRKSAVRKPERERKTYAKSERATPKKYKATKLPASRAGKQLRRAKNDRKR